MLLNCLSPVRIYNRYTNEYLSVPCRRCAKCMRKRTTHIRGRIMNEMELSKYSIFFTLTYNEKNVPWINKADIKELRNTNAPDRFRTLSKRDVQLFMKRLRKYIYNGYGKETKIRYYICGEYGPKTKRPHYHGIIFIKNAELRKDIFTYIRKAWTLGYLDCKFADKNTASYVASYIATNSILPNHLWVQESRPFALWSRRPPLGFDDDTPNFLGKVFEKAVPQMWDKHTSTFFPLPLYYQSKLFPRLPDYKYFTSQQRISMYGLFSYGTFSSRRDGTLQSDICTIGYRRRLHTVDLNICFIDGTRYYRQFTHDAWKGYMYTARKIAYLINVLGFSPENVEQNIALYYNRREKELLRMQLVSEDVVMKNGANLVDLLNVDQELIYALAHHDVNDWTMEQYNMLFEYGLLLEDVINSDGSINYAAIPRYDTTKMYRDDCANEEVAMKNALKRKTHNDNIGLLINN